MSSIEEKALALVNKVAWERGSSRDNGEYLDRGILEDEALCRAIEAHEADKQAFSDAVEGVHAALGLDDRNHRQEKAEAWGKLNSFIIKKPDPLVEALRDAGAGWDWAEKHVDFLHLALAARGLGVARIGEVVEGQQS